MDGRLTRDGLVGPYRIRHLIGQGGMGAVYLARDTRLGRRVALKIVLPERLSESSVEDFLAEARITARFSHPHIVQVYDVGEFDGNPYLALEYIEGRSLRQQLMSQRMPGRRALRVGYEIATALAEAHRADVLHRDLKPENVLLAEDGRARVVDFGLARVAPGAEVGPVALQTGLAGTPAYMAPEQWIAGTTSAASDVWALGVTLYEMLLGAHPFLEGEGDGTPHQVQALRQAISDGDSPAPSLPPDEFPDEVVALVKACLDRDPAGRPQSADVAARLDRILRGNQRQEDTDSCPFRGLLAFTEDERAVFFGRDAETALAVERLRTEPTLTVVGPTGTGKSSLAFAGIVPRMREQSNLVVITMRPGRDPIGLLASRLAASETVSSVRVPTSLETLDYTYEDDEEADLPTALDTPRREGSSIGEQLRRTPTSLSTLLLDLAEARRARVLLVVDQLEELETLTEDPHDRAAFLQAICTAADDGQEPVRVLLTVRDDFLGRLANTPESAQVLGRVLVVRPMDREGLRESLRRPLETTAHGVDDPALIERMLDEVEGTAAALPMLQFAARALWERRDRDERCLRMADYNEIGGVGGALVRHAEDVLTAMTDAQRELARQMLLRLITPDGTRRVPGWSELLDGMPSEAPDVLERLVQSRLLTVRESDSGREVELAHESLVLTWSRLRRWSSDAREEVRALHELEEAARLWVNRGRRLDDVWIDDSVGDLSTMTSSTDLAVSNRAREFLNASIAARERNQSRRRYLLAAGALALGAITLGSLITAVQFSEERQVAVAAAERADTSRAEALVSAGRAALASGDPLVAAAKLRAGLKLRDTPAGRGLWWDLQATPLLWDAQGGLTAYGVSTDHSGTKAVVAHNGGLVRVYDIWTGEFRTLRSTQEDLAHAVMSPDGRLVAAVDYTGLAWVWDMETGTPRSAGGAQAGWAPRDLWFRGEVLTALYLGYEDRKLRLAHWPVAGGDATVQPLDEAGFTALSPDGRTLAVAGFNTNKLVLWDLEGGDSTAVGTFADMAPAALSYDESGDRLVLVGTQIAVLDAHTGAELSRFDGVPKLYARRAFIRGNQLTVSGRHGGLIRFDLETGERVHRQPPPGADIYVGDSALGADDLLFSVQYTGIHIVRANSRPHQATQNGHRGQVEGLDVAPDGRIVSGSMDGSVRVWTPEGDERTLSDAGEATDINYVRITPEGGHVAVGATGGQAWVTSLEGGKPLVEMTLQDDVLGLGFSDPTTLWTADWNGTLTAFDVSAIESPEGGDAKVVAAMNYNTSLRGTATANGVTAATGMAGKVYLGPPGGHWIQAHASDVHTLVSGGGRLVTGGFDNTVSVWDSEGTLLQSHESHGPTRPSIDHAGTTLAWADKQGVQIHRLATGDIRRMWTRIPGNALALHPDGSHLYGADTDGNLRSWNTADGTPHWRGVALISDPPRSLTHRGWQLLSDGSPTDGPVRPPIDAVLAANRDGTWCWVSESGQVVRAFADSLSEPVDVGQPWWVGAGRDSCAVIDHRGFARVHQTDRVLIDATAYWARPHADGWLTIGDQITVRDAEDKALQSWPTPHDATAAFVDDEQTWIGYRDGLVELWQAGQHTEGTSITPHDRAAVTDIMRGPAGTLVVAQANGAVTVWEPASRSLLLDVKLHGPIRYWQLQDGHLSLLTEVGDGAVLDLSVFSQPWCQVLHELSTSFKVDWQDDHVVRAPEAPSCTP